MNELTLEINSMNFIPCIAWISKGVAASTPQKLQLSPEELKRLVNETKELCGQKDISEDEYFDDESEGETDRIVKNENEGETDKTEKNENEVETDEEDFDARYNLDSYDNDDEENPLFTINDIAVHVDNHDDEYLTDRESEDELEEKEDFTIKSSDNLLVVGHVEDDSSVLEVYVYNQEEDAFYVHHDIVLPSYPLALEWLDFDPSEEKSGNYIAIGDMSPVIQIWDLDIVDVLEPAFVLGKVSKKKKAKMIKNDDLKIHSDAVLSLSWNKLVRNLLASGSADSSIILWDLQEEKGLNQLSYHSEKVQSLQWHPSESPFLLSGSTDGFLKLYDCRSPDTECKSWKVDGEIERVVWNLHDSFKFFASTDLGFIHSVNIRNSEIEHSFQAHKEGVTGLDVCPLKPDVLVSASMDRTLKIWDIKNDFHMIKSYKLKVGSIYTAKAAPDLNLTVAVGGNYASNNLKVVEIFKDDKASLENEESSSHVTQGQVTQKDKLKISKKFKRNKY